MPAAVLVPAGLLAAITAAAEAAYPEECCGLLVGRGESGGAVEVSGIQPARNVAERPRERFEVDPQIRFDLMRRLRGTSERIVGHYHSHPDHPAAPSRHDAEMAFEPDLVWLILAVVAGRAAAITAHIRDPDGEGFRSLALATTAAGEPTRP